MPATACQRLLPFREHRDFAEVLETERLLRLRLTGQLRGIADHKRLDRLLAKAPLPPDTTLEPPGAA